MTTGSVRIGKQSDWQSLPIADRHASFEISVGNPRSSNDFLSLQITWAQSHFSTYSFSIGDQLNMYNYATIGHPHWGKLSINEARAVSNEEGDIWLKENLTLIESRLGHERYEIHRWSDWMNLSDVQNFLDIEATRYANSADFRCAIHHDVAKFLRRRRLQTSSEVHFRTLSQHILEELAVYRHQAESGPCVNIYPGSDHAILRASSPVRGLLPWLSKRHYANLIVNN
ncbi:hypothetical protein ACWEF6_13245 [Amycolatopsis sp. NPDC004772]